MPGAGEKKKKGKKKEKNRSVTGINDSDYRSTRAFSTLRTGGGGEGGAGGGAWSGLAAGSFSFAIETAALPRCRDFSDIRAAGCANAENSTPLFEHAVVGTSVDPPRFVRSLARRCNYNAECC